MLAHRKVMKELLEQSKLNSIRTSVLNQIRYHGARADSLRQIKERALLRNNKSRVLTDIRARAARALAMCEIEQRGATQRMKAPLLAAMRTRVETRRAPSKHNNSQLTFLLQRMYQARLKQKCLEELLSLHLEDSEESGSIASWLEYELLDSEEELSLPGHEEEEADPEDKMILEIESDTESDVSGEESDFQNESGESEEEEESQKTEEIAHEAIKRGEVTSLRSDFAAVLSELLKDTIDRLTDIVKDLERGIHSIVNKSEVLSVTINEHTFYDTDVRNKIKLIEDKIKQVVDTIKE